MQSSKQFIIDRILDQARLEGVTLTDIEFRMLKFTEASSGSKDLEAAGILERDYNEEEYEAKIANLIRHAYERDKQAGNQEAWDAALARVAGRDLYLNVMIRRSDIEKSPLGPLDWWTYFLYAVFPWLLAIGMATLVGFSPIGARFIHNDVVRLVITICIFATPYVILRSPKRTGKRARKSLSN